jgi:glycosyltransferase involved in cell wall biosynthesis
MTYNLSKLAVAIASNSVGMPTGYGVQAELIANRLLHAKAKVASFSNYGLEGKISDIKTPFGTIDHYPKGLSTYSDDIIPEHFAHFSAKNKGRQSFVLTLYDVWVYLNPVLDKLPIWSWIPVDHMTLHPQVAKWAAKDNVTPIAMAPHGKRLFDAAGIESVYIPHSVDTKVYKPTNTINGKPTREFMGIGEDDFLVGMVAANKANGQLHRKAFAENLMAFKFLLRDVPDAKIYIHSEPRKVYGGFDLGNLLKAIGIPEENVLFPQAMDYRYGFSTEHMAALYTAMDVLLAPSYGEGFGVPTIEAQACGTRVIASDFAASPDLVSEDCFVVDGQPFWDEPQNSWFSIPKIPSIYKALQAAYEERGKRSEASIQFAKDFDDLTVWNKYWLPFIGSQLK